MTTDKDPLWDADGKKEPAKRSHKASGPSWAVLEKQLDSALGGIALVVSTRDPFCGGVIAAGGPTLTEALIALAKQDPKVKRMLVAAVTAGGYSAVVFALLAMAVPIAAHHGILPENVGDAFGVPRREASNDGEREAWETPDDGPSGNGHMGGTSEPVGVVPGGSRHFDRSNQVGENDPS